MKTCTAHLKSVSPYSQSRPHITEKLEKEGPDDFEKRTWREKCHVGKDGRIVMPGMAFKMALDRAAGFLSLKIPGRNRQTYTKNFLAGIFVLDNPSLDIRKDEVEHEWVYCDANGKRGSGARVWRCFPLIHHWEVDVTFHIADETITKDVLELVLAESGKFIGVGRWRPVNGGLYGRYAVESTVWS